MMAIFRELGRGLDPFMSKASLTYHLLGVIELLGR